MFPIFAFVVECLEDLQLEFPVLPEPLELDDGAVVVAVEIRKVILKTQHLVHLGSIDEFVVEHTDV